ncbi:DUF4339 domain-containing protein [Fodinibius sp. SL11]|uniref:DUF4339 domain-containing protein n=1 Tax=Fodinibius sp. SL11 TaxID=3425690 RepID=UPI003F884844
MEEWYYVKENEKIGPVEKEELLNLIKQKVVKEEDLVWTQGMKDWEKSKKVEPLQSALDSVSESIDEQLSEGSNENKQETSTFDALENKYFWPMIILGSIIISFIIGGGTFPYILGQAMGLIIFPGLIVLIISGLMRLFKKKINSKNFNTFFLILWVSALFLSLVGNFLETQ